MSSFVHKLHLFHELLEQEPHVGVRAVREDAAESRVPAHHAGARPGGGRQVLRPAISAGGPPERMTVETAIKLKIAAGK
jgi:hypothetical protein